MAQSVVVRNIDRIDIDRTGGERTSIEDRVAVEEPLEIRVAGEAIAITMRTPGEDRWLTAGFLLAEGIVTDLQDLSRISHCGRPGTEGYGNTIDALPAAGVALPIEKTEASRRGTLTTSACGVCGRLSIEDLEARCDVIESTLAVHPAGVSKAVESLRSRQEVFDETGGVHAAGVADETGGIIVCCEDIGRHNAVDKVLGCLALGEAGTGTPAILAVSGRASFEIVQKAAASRVPVVASVSAASSLAVDLADRLGITLVGFVRGRRMNIYTHPERIL